MDAKSNAHTPPKPVWSLTLALHIKRTSNIPGLSRASSVTKRNKMVVSHLGEQPVPSQPIS